MSYQQDDPGGWERQECRRRVSLAFLQRESPQLAQGGPSRFSRHVRSGRKLTLGATILRDAIACGLSPTRAHRERKAAARWHAQSVLRIFDRIDTAAAKA
jgi:hypothetical protein